MQPQISNTAPADQLRPGVSTSPVVVQRAPRPPRRRPWWILAVVVVIIIAAAGYWRYRATNDTGATKLAASGIRTGKVWTARLDSSIRLTGTTGAENFSSLIAPQLRGSRSDRGRSGSGDSATTASSAVQSQSGGNSTSGSSNSAISGSGSSSNLSSALQAATSRINPSSSSSSTSSSSSSSSSSSTSSAAMGSSGLGSTSGSLTGTGGGGGGGGDFQLILQKLVKPGTIVQKGEVVAEFDRQNMLLRLDDYRASVMQTEASLTKLKADLEVQRKAQDQKIRKAKGALDKALLDMKTTPVLSDMDAERAKLAVEESQAKYKETVSETRLLEISLRSQLRNAELELQQSKIELKRVEANADRMLIKAPIPGLTVMQTIFRGSDLAQVQAGDQLFPGIMFMSIVDPKSMVVNATVNQADVEHLRIGSKARVRFDAYPDLTLPARVYSVGGIAKTGGQRASFVKEIPVRLKLEQLDPRVIPDLTVSAEITVESEAQEAAVAPLGAIFRDSPGQSAYVFVQSPAGWTRREVQLGLVNNIAATVRSGLQPGDVVALERPPQTGASGGQNN